MYCPWWWKNRMWLHSLIRKSTWRGEGCVRRRAICPLPPVLSAEAAQCSSLVAASMCSYWAADLAYHITDRKCYASLHLSILSRHFQHRHAWAAVSARRREQRFFLGGGGIGHFHGDSMQWRSQEVKGISWSPNCLEGPALTLKGPCPTSTVPCVSMCSYANESVTTHQI